MAEVKTSPVTALNLQDWDDFRDPDRPAVGKVPGSFRVTEPDSDREQSFHYCCPCGCGRTAPLTVGNGFKPADGPLLAVERLTRQANADAQRASRWPLARLAHGRRVEELLMLRALLIPSVMMTLIVLSGCGNSGPTEADMAGCAVRSGGPAMTYREVANRTRTSFPMPEPDGAKAKDKTIGP